MYFNVNFSEQVRQNKAKVRVLALFELKRLKEEAIRKEQEAIQKEKERQIEIQRLKEVAVSKSSERERIDFYSSFLFQTCFIVFVTFSSILKHPNKSFFNPINIYRLTSKYFRFKKKRKDKLNY